MAADFGGKSDPFVRVTLGNRLLYKSGIVKRTLEPEWNEEFTVPVPRNHAVTFTVMDHDAVGKSDYLGEVSLDPVSAATLGEAWYQLKGSKVKSGEILLSCQLPPESAASAAAADLDGSFDGAAEIVDEVAPSDGFEEVTAVASESSLPTGTETPASEDSPKQQDLVASAASASATATSPGSSAPMLADDAPPPPIRQKQTQKLPSHIEVTIVSGSSLMAADFNGTSDPYVVATVAGRQVHKTRVWRSTLNPVWRESFHMPLPDQGHLLRLATYDKDPVGKDDFLGEISLTRDNLLQMCQLKDESLLKLAGKKVTSGHLLVRCRRSAGPNAAPSSSTAAAPNNGKEAARFVNSAASNGNNYNFVKDCRISRSSDSILERDCDKPEQQQQQQDGVLLGGDSGGSGGGSGSATVSSRDNQNHRAAVKLRRRTGSLLRFLAPRGPRRTV